MIPLLQSTFIFSFCPDASGVSLIAQSVKNLPAMGMVRKIPWEGGGNPLQYSCLKQPHGQRRLAGCSPWGRRVRHNWNNLAHACLTSLCECLSQTLNYSSQAELKCSQTWIHQVSILGPGSTIYLLFKTTEWFRVVLDVPLSLTASLPKSYSLSSSVSSISMMLKIQFSISISAILTWAISHHSLCTHYLWTTLKSFLTSFHFHLIFHRLVELFLEDVHQCCPALHLLDLFHFLTAFYISYWSVFVGCACLYRWVPWEQVPRFSNHTEYNITGTQTIIC